MNRKYYLNPRKRVVRAAYDRVTFIQCPAGHRRGERKYLGEAAEHHSGDFNKGTCSRSVIF